MAFSFKNKTLFIATIVIIAFIAMALVQYHLFNKAIEANRRIFSSRITTIAHDASDVMREKMSITIIDSLFKLKNEKEIKVWSNFIKKKIDSTLQFNALTIEYEFAVYFHAERNPQADYEFVFGNLTKKFELKECRNEIGKDLDYVTWFLQDSKIGVEGHYALLIFFPKKSQYLLSQISGVILISILIALILISGFIYFLRTISKQRKISEIKNDFINNLTHEFKTPLFSIALANKLLKKNITIQNDEELSKYVSLIENENNRLRTQVDKILQVALIDAENFFIEKKSVDVHKLITDVAKSFELAINQKQGLLELNLAATDAFIMGDELHLKNMIYNLVDNALKYSGEKVEIKIETGNQINRKKNKEAHQLLIRISDKGIGMSEEVQENIFEKFYRAESGNIHNVKGFGLGLSYVKSIVDAHKGIVSIHSKPNEGTVFSILLPQQKT